MSDERLDKFIADSTAIHKGRYDYSKVRMQRLTDRVVIICPVHGAFRQRASAHKTGSRCIKCARIQSEKSKRKFSDNFYRKAKALYGEGKYSYSDTEYTGSTKSLTIRCLVHGTYFDQIAMTHLAFTEGCAQCRRDGEYLKDRVVDSKGYYHKMNKSSFIAYINRLYKDELEVIPDSFDDVLCGTLVSVKCLKQYGRVVKFTVKSLGGGNAKCGTTEKIAEEKPNSVSDVLSEFNSCNDLLNCFKPRTRRK